MRVLVGFVAGLLTAAVVVAGWQLARSKRPAMLLGHLRYAVADPETLVPVDDEATVLLQPKAARAFLAMQRAAGEAGITIVPVSGFRDLSRQRQLFFGLAASLGQSVRERSKVCAPPGFSEHHTGYSLDVGDGERHDTQLNLRFKDTAAFQWMRRHAARFHFELSFPPNNRRRVAYEPWHWRYVGDQASLRAFYFARFGAKK